MKALISKFNLIVTDYKGKGGGGNALLKFSNYARAGFFDNKVHIFYFFNVGPPKEDLIITVTSLSNML